ncbi:MAG: diphthamide biosynthesis enzyme Dph2 [Desulfurococcales archaeon ex4484_217_1]|nr:MAG: diphthamide biosynthesis enzyme Dph2 [Desulfurococcales archaeon ex4484_217_1]
MGKQSFYDFKIEDIIEFIMKRKAKKVLIQAPNGLKHLFLKHLEELKKELPNVEFIISGDPAYGSCFLAEIEAKRVNADLIVHVGHTEYYKATIPTIYVEAFSKLALTEKLAKKLLNYIKNLNVKNIGLCGVLQHLRSIEQVKKLLENNGYKVYIGKHGPYTKYDGQVVGCDYVSALTVNSNVDLHLIVSGGLFHPVGLGLATLKPVVKLDPYEEEVVDLTKEVKKVLRKRYWRIMESLNAENYGVIVGMRKGQYRPNLVKSIEKLVRRKGGRSTRIVMDIVTEENLLNLDNSFDAYIVTSCPRIPIDNLGEFRKPVLTPGEAYMVLTESLEKYIFPW